MGVWRHRRFLNDVDAKYSDPYWYKDSKETEVQQHLPEIWVFGDSVKFEGSGVVQGFLPQAPMRTFCAGPGYRVQQSRRWTFDR